ncbi:hypothetical protein AMS68_001017 [Peltaster fructicola]|uniref:Carboxylesterase type B domain-containing protein n=1 Tax=Peltaster fructicola TaxID=286661 RepID=A0A6H0XLX2_9PEZI|nr:hypothetical protein AMS68_001017 [Peltaster fructicola]
MSLHRSLLSAVFCFTFTLCHEGTGSYRPAYGDLDYVAKTSNGPIVGHIASNQTSVVEYLGIPYAAPPVGQLRFAAPQPYTGFGFQNASSWGYDCPASTSPPSRYPGLTPQAQRIIDYFIQSAATPQAEDCLTLNIWRPLQRQSRGRALPVLVFFYGGKFTNGHTNTPFYDGQYLSGSQEFIVVTLNFRSNIFGFPGVPGQLQNLGLRDQRLGVEWIERNIAAFNGDPERIVLMGHSAGAVAVDYWSYAYVGKPIVKGLISHSGTALSFPLNADGVVTKNWYNVSAQLGCGSSGDVLPCMRTKHWQDITVAANKIPAARSNSPLRSTAAFYPIVDNITIFADYEARSNAGLFAKIPYFLGNNQNEQGYYALAAYDGGVNTTTAQGNEFLLSSFTCPCYFEASNRHKYGVPVWLWRYFGDWDNIRLYSGSGAYHGSDMQMIFGNSAQVSGIDPSHPEQLTTALMQRTWAAFINDPVDGLTHLGYPGFNTSTESLIRFAYDNDPQPSYVSPLTALRDTVDTFADLWDPDNDESMGAVERNNPLPVVATRLTSEEPRCTRHASQNSLSLLPQLQLCVQETAVYSVVVQDSPDPLDLLLAVDDLPPLKQITPAGEQDQHCVPQSVLVDPPDFSTPRAKVSHPANNVDAALCQMAGIGTLCDLARLDKCRDLCHRSHLEQKQKRAETVNGHASRLMEYWWRYNKNAQAKGMMQLPVDLPVRTPPCTSMCDTTYNVYCYLHGLAPDRHHSCFIVWELVRHRYELPQHKAIERWKETKKRYLAPLNVFSTQIGDELAEAVLLSFIHTSTPTESLIDRVALHWLRLANGMDAVMIWIYSDLGLPLVARRIEARFLELSQLIAEHQNAVGYQYGEIEQEDPDEESEAESEDTLFVSLDQRDHEDRDARVDTETFGFPLERVPSQLRTSCSRSAFLGLSDYNLEQQAQGSPGPDWEDNVDEDEDPYAGYPPLNLLSVAGIRGRLLSEEQGKPKPLSSVLPGDQVGCLRSLRSPSTQSSSATSPSTSVVEQVARETSYKNHSTPDESEQSEVSLTERLPATTDVALAGQQIPDHHKRDSRTNIDWKGKRRAVVAAPVDSSGCPATMTIENIAPWRLEQYARPRAPGSSSSAPDPQDTEGGSSSPVNSSRWSTLGESSPAASPTVDRQGKPVSSNVKAWSPNMDKSTATVCASVGENVLARPRDLISGQEHGKTAAGTTERLMSPEKSERSRRRGGHGKP